MNISFFPLLPGNSGVLTTAEPKAEIDSVDAFLLLMGAVPVDVSPLCAQKVANHATAESSVTASGDDIVADEELDTELTLPIGTTVMFPHTAMALNVGSGIQNAARSTGVQLSKATDSVEDIAPVVAQQIAPPDLVAQSSLQTNPDALLSPAMLLLPDPQGLWAAGPMPDATEAPGTLMLPMALAVADVPMQLQRADDGHTQSSGFVNSTPAAPPDLVTVPVFPDTLSATMPGIDAEQPLSEPVIGEAKKAPTSGQTVLSVLLEAKAAPETPTPETPANVVQVPPSARATGYHHVVAQAQHEGVLQPVLSQPGAIFQQVQAQSFPGFVTVTPRAHVQEIPVSEVHGTVDTTFLATSAFRPAESRLHSVLPINSTGHGSALPSGETAALLPAEPSVEPGMMASDAGPSAHVPAAIHQPAFAAIERAPEMQSIKLADLTATIARAAVNDAVQTTTLQLDPIELGTVAFTMDTGPSGLIVTIIAERPETLDLLRRNADQFLGDLRQSGFQGASLQFGQSGTGQQGSGQPSTGHSAHQDQPAHRYSHGAGDQLQSATRALETASESRRQITGQALDLRL